MNVAVIGLGMGRHHLDHYLEDPRCTVVAIADPDPDRLREIAEKHHIPNTYADGAQLLESERLDAVSIATPNNLHCRLALKAFEKGAHVLTEKPMATNVRDAIAMRDAARKADRNLMVNFSYRFSGMSQALKEQVDAGVLGDIYFGRTVWHRRRGMPGFGGWFSDKEQAGGGPLIDLGVHRIDLALWFMGHPEPVSVCGSTYDIIAADVSRREGKAFSVEDLACGMVKFANGATLMIETSWALQINEPERMLTELYGPRGSLVQRNIDGDYTMGAELHVEEDGNFYTKTLDHSGMSPPSSYAEFVDSIDEGRQPSASADHGLAVQRIIEGLYDSARNGQVVTLESESAITGSTAVP